ncbi:MAG: c-type cytochrome [Solirubrobacteraceae bacterium]
MRRWSKFLVVPVALAAALSISACGTQRITVPKANTQIYHGAVLFSERCAGCHTLYAAGTHGSAPNIRTAQAISGPNFNVRCERPIDRVLYAIENGGFSGAYMPQNVVVGQDAIDVAKFVATYAGAQAPKQIGIVNCNRRAIGQLPPGTGQATASTGSSSGSTGTSTTPTSTTPTSSTSTTSTTTAAGSSSGSSAAVSIKAGMKVFETAGCASCHTLAAAGSTGTVGPNLDQLKPSDALVTHQVINGGGGMPAFGSILSKSQIDSVALFVSSVAGKPTK